MSARIDELLALWQRARQQVNGKRAELKLFEQHAQSTNASLRVQLEMYEDEEAKALHAVERELDTGPDVKP